MKQFPVTVHPHLHVPRSVSGIFGRRLMAAAPLLLSALVLLRGSFLKVLVLSFLASAFSALAASGIYKKKFEWEFSDAGLVILTALILPPTASWWSVFLAAFAGFFIGKEFWGGRGFYFVSPTLLAYAFLIMNASESSGIFGSQIFSLVLQWNFASIFIGLSFFAAGILLLANRLIHFEIPLLYMLVIWGAESLLGWETPVLWIFFLGFFILTEPMALPMSRRGQRGFTLLSGLLGVGLGFLMPPVFGFCFGILMGSLFMPWFDLWPRPFEQGPKVKTPAGVVLSADDWMR